jgi:hypothetical protein
MLVEFGNITDYLPSLKYYKSIFCVSGALSVDKDERVKMMARGAPRQWWKAEQIATKFIPMVIEEYLKCKPQLMLTHDAPICLKNHLADSDRHLRFDQEYNRTTSLLQLLFSLHQPERWIFGHYHMIFSQTVMNCHFTCLPEAGIKEIELL